MLWVWVLSISIIGATVHKDYGQFTSPEDCQKALLIAKKENNKVVGRCEIRPAPKQKSI
jgi:hypothetical protein